MHGRTRTGPWRVAMLVVGIGVLAACGGSSAAPSPAEEDAERGTSTLEGSSADTDRSLTLVALGDSWPEGAHCGGCETFAGRYADGLEDQTGASVEFIDLTGQAQPFFMTAGGGSASLLRALTDDPAFAEQVASGDVIMIATGPNEIERAFIPYSRGRCREGFACVRELEEFWRHNFDAIVDEIERLREGQPTVIRLVSAANFFVSEPGATEGLPADAMEFGAAVFEALNGAACFAARLHEAACVDVRRILNGPTLDEPVDENADESMQEVADVLLRIGLPELKTEA